MSRLSGEGNGGTIVRNPAWGSTPGLVHGFLTRDATPSPGRLPLAQLAAEAAEGLRLAGAEGLILVGADQVHGDRVVEVGEDGGGAVPETADGMVRQAAECDALVTARPGVLLAIRTADCVPILLQDAEAGVIGACHCGWRGLFENLTARTVEAMTRLGARPGSTRAWIGPCIRAENYEVGPGLLGKFAERYPPDFWSRFPDLRLTPDGTRLDLAALAAAQLRGAGLPPDGIGDSGICTHADAARCHSWRRDGEAAGRTLTVIGLRPQGA